MTNNAGNGQEPNLDPFNPEALRLPQNFAETVGVKKLLLTVPVRKPNKQDFSRVHPDENYRMSPAAILELKEDRETYLVTPDMAVQLPGEFTPAVLYTASTGRAYCSSGPSSFLKKVKNVCSNGTDRRVRRQNWRCVAGCG